MATQPLRIGDTVWTVDCDTVNLNPRNLYLSVRAWTVISSDERNAALERRVGYDGSLVAVKARGVLFLSRADAARHAGETAERLRAKGCVVVVDEPR